MTVGWRVNPLTADEVIAQTRCWVEQFVVDLNLCPFARRELENERVRFVVARVTEPIALLGALERELDLLINEPDVETTLLIHPDVLGDFVDYNDFLADCDALLGLMGLEGVFQVASFHPEYQFAGTCPDDPENYTNRSPFPMLHLLREDSVEAAINAYPAVDNIPLRNIQTLNAMGLPALLKRLERCAG